MELTRALCSGLSGTLLTAALAKSSPYGRKQSKVLLTLQTWLRFKSHRETLESEVATGTQIRITETMTASFLKAGDRKWVQTWLSEGQLQVVGVHLSVKVSVCLLSLRPCAPGLLLPFWSTECLITAFLSAGCSKRSVEQVDGRRVTGQTSLIDLHLTCMTDTALLPGHEMVLFALLRFCCWTDKRWRGFLSLLLSFIGWIALFLVFWCFFGLSSLLQMVSYAFSCKAEQGLNKYLPFFSLNQVETSHSHQPPSSWISASVWWTFRCKHLWCFDPHQRFCQDPGNVVLFLETCLKCLISS